MIKTALAKGLILNKEFAEKLVFFQREIRNEFEHKKSFTSTSKGMFLLLEKEDSEFFDETEANREELEIIHPYVAYKALDYYCTLYDYYYDFLIKRNEERWQRSESEGLIR
ncbi:MAG: hypothetical protein ACFFCQ_13215 [Promethearchaeota archaeon]